MSNVNVLSNVTGSDLQLFLVQKAKERTEAISQAEKLMAIAGTIENEIFNPLNLNPDNYAKPTVKTGKTKARKTLATGRAKKGELREAVLNVIGSKSATTADIVAEFRKHGYATNAYVVLGRMKKLREIKAVKEDGKKAWIKA